MLILRVGKSQIEWSELQSAQNILFALASDSARAQRGFSAAQSCTHFKILTSCFDMLQNYAFHLSDKVYCRLQSPPDKSLMLQNKVVRAGVQLSRNIVSPAIRVMLFSLKVFTSYTCYGCNKPIFDGLLFRFNETFFKLTLFRFFIHL